MRQCMKNVAYTSKAVLLSATTEITNERHHVSRQSILQLLATDKHLRKNLTNIRITGILSLTCCVVCKLCAVIAHFYFKHMQFYLDEANQVKIHLNRVFLRPRNSKKIELETELMFTPFRLANVTKIAHRGQNKLLQ